MPDRRPVRKVTANAGDSGMREKCILSAKVIVSSDDDLLTLGRCQGITMPLAGTGLARIEKKPNRAVTFHNGVRHDKRFVIVSDPIIISHR